MRINVTRIEMTRPNDGLVSMAFKPQDIEIRLLDYELDQLNGLPGIQYNYRTYWHFYGDCIRVVDTDKRNDLGVWLYMPVPTVLAIARQVMATGKPATLDENDMELFRREYWPRPSIYLRPITTRVENGEYVETPLIDALKPHMAQLAEKMRGPINIARNSGSGRDATVSFSLDDPWAYKNGKPPSLYWVIMSKGRRVMNGGIIWHEGYGYSVHT